ncbi:unnamed protein product, partial [Oppiella nova]
ACIARNHVSLYQNHHEFFMIYCTANQADWKTNPLGKVIECGNQYNDIPDDGVGLDLCANANVQSDPYLEEVIAATDTLYPEFTSASDPLVIINGRVNNNANTQLKTEVCKAYPTISVTFRTCIDIFTLSIGNSNRSTPRPGTNMS